MGLAWSESEATASQVTRALGLLAKSHGALERERSLLRSSTAALAASQRLLAGSSRLRLLSRPGGERAPWPVRRQAYRLHLVAPLGESELHLDSRSLAECSVQRDRMAAVVSDARTVEVFQRKLGRRRRDVIERSVRPIFTPRRSQESRQSSARCESLIVPSKWPERAELRAPVLAFSLRGRSSGPDRLDAARGGAMRRTHAPEPFSVLATVGAMSVWAFPPGADVSMMVRVAQSLRRPADFRVRQVADGGDVLTVQVLSGVVPTDPEVRLYLQYHGAFEVVLRGLARDGKPQLTLAAWPSR